MKTQIKKQKPNQPSNSQAGPSTFFKYPKQKKKMLGNDSKPLVLLSNISKNYKRPIVCKKKMLQHANKVLSSSKKNSNWEVSPVKNVSDDSNSSFDAYSAFNSLQNISQIYKNHADISFSSQYGDLSHEDFDKVIEDAEYLSDVESNESATNFYLKQIGKNAQKKEKRSTLKKEKPISVTGLPSNHAKIVVMDHPNAVTLNGYVCVEVLSGSVLICGHELTHRDLPIRVFSSFETGFAQLTTENFDPLWKRKEIFLSLYNHLMKLTGCLKKTRKILSKFGNKTVAVVISSDVLPANLQFLRLYYPSLFTFSSKNRPVSKQCDAFPSKVFHSSLRGPFGKLMSTTVNFSHQTEDLASDINITIRTSKLRDSEGPRMIAYGSQNCGKSTLLRFLMNKALTLFPVVYYLDTDPGQTEFTPPGVVSLTAVKKAVFGPPFSHQRKPVSMCFLGSLSAGSSPDMYSRCVEKLFFLYKQNFVKEPLFVNTMGWMQGIGLECLKNVMKIVKPTVVVEFASPEGDFMFDYREYSSPKVQFFQVPIPKKRDPITKARRYRELALLSYFGKCQLRHEKPNHFTSFKPYCVSWDKIPVYKYGSRVVPYRLIESLNASVVALCRVDESLILESQNPKLPKTLEDDPDNECIGFGIVRAVDEAKHLLYIVSPLTLDEIKHVNAIMRGNITVPDVLFINQPIVDAPLPFTRAKINLDEIPITIFEDEIHTKNKGLDEYLSDPESVSEEETQHPLNSKMLAENFDKKVSEKKKVKYA